MGSIVCEKKKVFKVKVYKFKEGTEDVNEIITHRLHLPTNAKRFYRFTAVSHRIFGPYIELMCTLCEERNSKIVGSSKYRAVGLSLCKADEGYKNMVFIYD